MTPRFTRELCLDFYALRRRAESAPERLAVQEPAQEGGFFELPLCAAPSPECVVEIEDGQGARLRLELKGATPAHLETVVRTLWSLSR